MAELEVIVFKVEGKINVSDGIKLDYLRRIARRVINDEAPDIISNFYMVKGDVLNVHLIQEDD